MFQSLKHTLKYRQPFWVPYQVLELMLEGFKVHKYTLKKCIVYALVRNYISLFENINNQRSSDPRVKGLAVDGFQELPQLSSELTEELVTHFLNKTDAPVSASNSLADYFNLYRKNGIVRPKGVNLLHNTALLNRVLSETQLLEIVEEHLGIGLEEMTIQVTIDSLIRLEVDRKLINNYDEALAIHRDFDALRFVKAFFYLNKVDEGCGHHEVFLGTHKNLPFALRGIRRFVESDLRAKGLNPIPHKVTGDKGYGFIENTSAFHRGTVPTVGDRLILTLVFHDTQSHKALWNFDSYAPLSPLLELADI